MLVSAETIFCPLSLVSKAGCAVLPVPPTEPWIPTFPRLIQWGVIWFQFLPVKCTGRHSSTAAQSHQGGLEGPTRLPEVLKVKFSVDGVVAICGNTSKTSQQGSSCHFRTKKAHLKPPFILLLKLDWS